MSADQPVIRVADESELERLREIEVLASRAFLELGMARIAADEPDSLETLRDYAVNDRVWVAGSGANPVVGYLLMDVIDGAGHIEQVSVDPAYAGQGIGRSLIDHAGEWAAMHGLPALTLTTFLEVPWNAPYYERLGFCRVPDQELTAGLVRLRRHEATLGLDEWPRIVMRRESAHGRR